MRAFQAYELGVLPSGKGIDDEEPEMLNLLLMVKEERMKAEAAAAKAASRQR